MKIEIPKPCHEDWNKMQAVEGGAFCSVCNKKVHDFSRQNLKEVKRFFDNKKPEERVCGRFSVKQVFTSNFDDFFSRFRLWNLTKKIAVILFFMFGMGSCNLFPPTGEMVERNHLTGDSIAVNSIAIDTLPALSGDTIVNINK